MDLIVGFSIFIIAVFSLYVFAPLFQLRRRTELAWEDAQGILKQLYQEKERLYLNLAEIDFEHASGKISDEEYKISREELMRETVSLIKRIDELERGKESSSYPKKNKGKKGVEKKKAVDKVEEEIKKFKKEKGKRK
jgi:hypothetical protein